MAAMAVSAARCQLVTPLLRLAVQTSPVLTTLETVTSGAVGLGLDERPDLVRPVACKHSPE